MFEALGTDLFVYIGSFFELSLCELLCTFSIVSKHFSLSSQTWIQFLPRNIHYYLNYTSKHIEWITTNADKIKRLDISNSVSQIPFKNLQTMDVFCGNVRLENYPKLVNLRLNNKFKYHLTQMPYLQTLSLSDVPTSMNWCPNLTHLDVSFCQIKNVEMLFCLESLVLLNMQGNQNLSSLQGIQYLCYLKAINISNTNIKNIKILNGLKYLELIYFSRNLEDSFIDLLETNPKLERTYDWRKSLLERKIICDDGIVW
jgi:hypothetical protein